GGDRARWPRLPSRRPRVRHGVRLAHQPLQPPQPLLQAPAPAGRARWHLLPRPPPHLRHPPANAQRPPQARPRIARARHDLHDARHLLPLPAQHGRPDREGDRGDAGGRTL
ncbi:MAG: Phage integrase, partial [uncultured Rubrobacteraceae bacterium]